MTLNEARLIREVKKRCTYRRLAEIYFPKDDPRHGNQGWGEDLCVKALETLYPDCNYWMNPPEFNMEFYEGNSEPDSFFSDNHSYAGTFWWWECG